MKFNDLRRTFGSVLAQTGVSTAVIQRLSEHSPPELTNKVYMNVDPVLRHAVDQMRAVDWVWSRSCRRHSGGQSEIVRQLNLKEIVIARAEEQIV
ncbi:MAG: hypothetical protein ACYTDV_21685 [Planctomycetota bacterium]